MFLVKLDLTYIEDPDYSVIDRIIIKGIVQDDAIGEQFSSVKLGTFYMNDENIIELNDNLITYGFHCLSK